MARPKLDKESVRERIAKLKAEAGVKEEEEETPELPDEDEDEEQSDEDMEKLEKEFQERKKKLMEEKQKKELPPLPSPSIPEQTQKAVEIYKDVNVWRTEIIFQLVQLNENLKRLLGE